MAGATPVTSSARVDLAQLELGKEERDGDKKPPEHAKDKGDAHRGRGLPQRPTRGVTGGTVAGMGAGVGETEQNRNFRFPNPEPPGFGAKQIQFWSAQTTIFAQQFELWPK